MSGTILVDKQRLAFELYLDEHCCHHAECTWVVLDYHRYKRLKTRRGQASAGMGHEGGKGGDVWAASWIGSTSSFRLCMFWW